MIFRASRRTRPVKTVVDDAGSRVQSCDRLNHIGAVPAVRDHDELEGRIAGVRAKPLVTDRYRESCLESRNAHDSPPIR